MTLIRTGTVTHFRAEKSGGFVWIRGIGKVYFHAYTYRITGEETYRQCPRDPEVGDKLSCHVNLETKGLPRAEPWCFLYEASVRAEPGSRYTLEDLPQKRDGFLPGDVVVADFDAGRGGVGERMNWVDVIYRPSTNELFRVDCWDGTCSAFVPKLPDGRTLPDGPMPKDVEVTLR